MDILRCLKSISTLCPGAQSSLRIPTTTSIDNNNNNNNNTTNKEIKNQIHNNMKIQNNNTNKTNNYKNIKTIENNQMRDLYNRKKKLDY